MPMQPNEQAFVDAFEEDPVLVMRALQLRMLASHRGISQRQLAKRVGVSPARINQALRFAAGTRVNHMDLYDKIDDAIDQITREAGGIQEICGCSDEAMEDYRQLIGGHQMGELRSRD